ncbi:MAG: Spy/CpxP family protein refolding chaperone [Pseudomonadota bacterium]
MVEKQDNSEENTTPEKKDGQSSGFGKKVVVLSVASALLLGGAFGAQSLAQSKAYAHWKVFSASEDGGWGRHEGRRGGRGHHGPRLADMSDAEIDDKVTRMVKHVAIEIDANEEQTEKIRTLLIAVAKDLKPLRAEMRATRDEIHGILLQDTIDRTELERIRVERLAEADRISKNLVTAIADVGDVLTAEQRRVLDERIKQFRGKRGGWRRG